VALGGKWELGTVFGFCCVEELGGDHIMSIE